VHTAFARIVCIYALLAAIAPLATAQVAPSALLEELATPALSAQLESPTLSAQLKLTPESEVVFASRETGIAIMTIRDDYVSRMSRFDRMLRLKSTQPVTERTYLDFVAANVLEWTDAERERLKPLVQRMQAALQQFRLPLPSTVLLIKTTGQEEVGQAHTRANAIVLPGVVSCHVTT